MLAATDKLACQSALHVKPVTIVCLLTARQASGQLQQAHFCGGWYQAALWEQQGCGGSHLLALSIMHAPATATKYWDQNNWADVSHNPWACTQDLSKF